MTCPSCHDTGRCRLVYESSGHSAYHAPGGDERCPDCDHGEAARECGACGEHGYREGSADGCVRCGALACSGCGRDVPAAEVAHVVSSTERYCERCHSPLHHLAPRLDHARSAWELRRSGL